MRFLVAVLAIANTTSAHAGGLGAVPPVEISVGLGAPVGGSVETSGPSTEVMAGLSWASLAWKPTTFDLGIGVVFSDRDLVPQTARRTTSPVPATDNTLSLAGGYMLVATTLANHRHWRTWLAGRGELFKATAYGRDMPGLGAALRITTELYKASYDMKGRGMVYGSIAIGIYAEAAYRELPEELGQYTMTTGLTCRLPLTGGSSSSR